ncbi:MAG: hypothetical protein EAX96_04740 [Candidatus Lokiarchaeota archaeon]|nr:hypothetical protein [Candidatus Lokiarchaeota archaeon]
MGKIYIDKVNKKVVNAVYKSYEKAEFVGTYNRKFAGTNAEKIMVREYFKVLKRLIKKKYKKVIVKHNDLNVMKYYHPSVLSLDLRAFLLALNSFNFDKKYLMIKSGSIVPAYHNIKLLDIDGIIHGLGYKILDGNRAKIQPYKTKIPEVPILYVPKAFDKDTLFVIFSDAKTNSFSGATIACKIAVVGTSAQRLKYHKTLDKKNNYTNIFGKYLTTYSQAMEHICGDVVSVINYKYKKEGTTCTYFESSLIQDPFILSGHGICAIDHAGELIMFGAPKSNMIKGYQEIFKHLPTLKMDNANAEEELLNIHRNLKYDFPKLDFKIFESIYPGLKFTMGRECQDGCSAMALFAFKSNQSFDRLKDPKKCGNKIRIVTGKVEEHINPKKEEFTVAIGDCAIKNCPKADLKICGCPVSPFASMLFPFLIPGFPSVNLFNFIEMTNAQYALLFTDNPWMIWPTIRDLLKSAMGFKIFNNQSIPHFVLKLLDDTVESLLHK